MNTMLERETNTIINTLTERTIGSAHSVTLKDILVEDMPKSIKLYLQCEVMRLLQDDLMNSAHFSNIRFATPTVQHLTKMYTRSIAVEYSFTKDEFSTILENAVHFVENYLCRPQWTLGQFMFEKGDRISIAEMQNKFAYLCEYLYYAKLVLGFVQQRPQQEITRANFLSLLSRIDDNVVKQHNAQELAHFTRPIFEFFLQQTEIKEQSIPISPILVFLDDKKLGSVKNYVEQICSTRKTEVLTIEQLAEIISDLYGETKSKSGQALPSSDSPIQPEVEKPTEATSEHPAQETGPPPALSKESIMEEAELPVPVKESAAPASDRRNIALSLTFSGMSAVAQGPASSPSFRDIRTMIDEELQQRFVRAVFQNDGGYYNVVIDALNAMTSWKDASLYLQTFYETSSIDPYTPDVVKFTDLIQLRYSFPEP